MPSITFLMSADTSPAERPDTLALMLTSRAMSRRLIWLEPVVSTTCATWLRRTTRVDPSALVPKAKGSRSRSCGLLRASGSRRTLTS